MLVNTGNLDIFVYVPAFLFSNLFQFLYSIYSPLTYMYEYCVCSSDTENSLCVPYMTHVDSKYPGRPTENHTENLKHARTVCTLSLSGTEGPGYEDRSPSVNEAMLKYCSCPLEF